VHPKFVNDTEVVNEQLFAIFLQRYIVNAYLEDNKLNFKIPINNKFKNWTQLIQKGSEYFPANNEWQDYLFKSMFNPTLGKEMFVDFVHGIKISDKYKELATFTVDRYYTGFRYYT